MTIKYALSYQHISHFALFLGVLCALLVFSASANDAPDTAGMPQEGAATIETKTPPPQELPEPLTSILLTPAENQAIILAKTSYGRQGLGDFDIYDENDLIDQLNKIKLGGEVPDTFDGANIDTQDVSPENMVPTFFTQFYLESIIYHHAKEWKARVRINNDSKELTSYVSDSLQDKLKIVSVSREQVTFEWAPEKDWQQVINSYKQDSSAIFIDKDEQKVIFSLMVNQTLFSYDMTLREGVMTPIQNVAVARGGSATTIEPFSPDMLQENDAPTLEDILEDGGDTANNPPQQRQGIGGLIGAYHDLGK